MCDNIIWKPIKSLNERYEASNTGLVRNAKTKYILKPQNSRFGYYIMTVKPTVSEQVNIRVHRVIAEAFLGACPEGYVVNHKDGDKHNNNIANLEYVTSSENNIHALRNNLRSPAKMSQYAPHGEDSYLAKLTEEQVIEILKYHYRTGVGCRKIAKKFNLPLGAVNGVLSKSRPRWKHIDREKIKNEILKEKEN